VRAVLEGLLRDVAEQYPKNQLPAEFDVDRIAHENGDYAAAQAKWALLREELIKAEGIEVADEDLQAVAERESKKINIAPDRLLEYYRTSDQVRERILGDKLIRRLMERVTVEDVEDTTLTPGKKG
jgi:FKBP-type peptidyl-prolyl cis-trans isomerase (trigger factor)